jgi:hypothetical protein
MHQMDQRTQMGAAMAGAYLLGRTKKGTTAVKLALWYSGSRAGLNPRLLLREGLLALARSPQARELAHQLRGPVAQAGRRVVVVTLENRATAWADALRQRTELLQGGPDGDGSRDEGAEDDKDAPVEETEPPKEPRKAQPSETSSEEPSAQSAEDGGGSQHASASTGGEGGSRKAPDNRAPRERSAPTRRGKDGTQEQGDGVTEGAA